MQKMKDIVSNTIRNLGLQKPYNDQSVIVHWSEIVGDDIAANAYARSVQQGTLMVSVNSSVWSHHLSMMKESIIDKINQFIGYKLIFDIRFQAGYFSNSQNEEDTAINAIPNIKYQLSKVKLDEYDVQTMQETSNHISDKYLKQKILRIMRKDFALKKIKKQHNWHQCASCTVLCPPEETYCTACTLNKKQKLLYTIINTLKEIPWIRYAELYEHITCTEEEFQQAKYTLTAFISRDIQEGDNDKFKIMSFIMLTTGAKIEAVNDAIINKTLEKFRRKK
ncbi:MULTISPECIES: DUF721 domain-containing protein [Pelosinus]|uniref:DUF721 domain-containing protein n=1 Tax=Pelosinus fermentans B4 TaxID=1149862 RepID=I9LAZ1_9FIRM|nr:MULTISPECIES: DUF721 domain-containing protein [Pelosinus]EIW17594.1 protein of unknown function DUF721 [Pelosinus fermentans B4]EIW23331.1 protein of unknown function DUF721 [Pelosinus fermentans A11]OAM92149.1 protein of unknown function DUF721 [Pelosinus fermentans DSM 17108]SDQ34904.1 Protein of unknown function [Pelosinus fermentans]